MSFWDQIKKLLHWMKSKISLFFQSFYKPTFPLSKSRIPGFHFFLFDTETTGLLNTDRIVEFAIKEFTVSVEDPRTCRGLSFLVNPEKHILNSNIHNITNEMVSSQPTMIQSLPKLYDFVESRSQGSVPILIAHNAIFDQRMLFLSLNGDIQSIKHWRFSCSIQDIFKPILNLPKNNLAFLADHFKITNPQPHRAMGDIITLEGILEKCCTVDQLREVTTRATQLPTADQNDYILYNQLRSLPRDGSYQPSDWEWARISMNRPRNQSELSRLIGKTEFIYGYGKRTLEILTQHRLFLNIQ